MAVTVIGGRDFQQQDDYYVRFQKDTMIMVTPMGDPKDKLTKWEGFLHKDTPTAEIVDKIESYSKEAVVSIAEHRNWFK